MRVLVTRPRPDADTTAALLRARGHVPLVVPLLEIVPLAPGQPFGIRDVQAFLVTSANGARVLAAATPARSVRVFAVGAASAETARAVGFDHVESADGDVETLAALVTACLVPSGGRLIHAAGSVSAGDLGGTLEKAGFDVEKKALYRAETPEVLPAALESLLRDGGIDAALFYSPRTARTFADLVNRAGLVEKLSDIDAFCLSRAVADGLESLPFSDVQVSYTPEQVQLLELLG